MGTIAPLVPPPARRPAASDPAPRTFVLEIGSEELPPDDVAAGIEQVKRYDSQRVLFRVKRDDRPLSVPVSMGAAYHPYQANFALLRAILHINPW